MTKLQPVRGTKDLLPEEHSLHSHVMHVAKRTSMLYGYQTVSTPIFEFTEVFSRTLGETSDVVNKEMYSFTDKGGEGITLRPEFTAGIVRAVISNGLLQELPLKYFSAGPLFRYERPQKGRQRQFHQVNFECIGIAGPEADVEMIAMASHILQSLGIEKGLTLQLNSLGDKESRQNYRAALVKYLSGFKDKLSEDSKRRLESNPLRILDSKDEGDRAIIANAPAIEASFTDAAKVFFASVKEGLDALGIAYQVNPKIVRGLDYYCHTVFEFTVNSDEMGSQNTILAGGRYDGLIGQMGGQETPAIGFAAGIERLCLVAEPPAKSIFKAAIIGMGDNMEIEVLKFAQELRQKDIEVDIITGSNPKKKLHKADKRGVTLALLLGEDELKKGVVQVRDLAKGNQQELPRSQVVALLHDIRKNVG